jgi:hypothetical protein
MARHAIPAIYPFDGHAESLLKLQAQERKAHEGVPRHPEGWRASYQQKLTGSLAGKTIRIVRRGVGFPQGSREASLDAEDKLLELALDAHLAAIAAADSGILRFTQAVSRQPPTVLPCSLV